MNHFASSYVIKLGGVTDADGTVSLAVGSNVITVEVTAEDGMTKQTYTVTVTRAPPSSTDATLSGLTLSGIDIGTFASLKTSYAASVYNSVSQTTVTPTLNHSAASYVIKLGGVTDADGTVSLAVGSNVIAVEVTAEDGMTKQTYTATVNRATASAPTTGELSTDNPPVNFRNITIDHESAIYSYNFPRNRGIYGWVIQRYEHDGSSFVSSGAEMRGEYTGSTDLGGEGFKIGDSNVMPGVQYKWVLKLTNSQGSTVIEVSLTVRSPAAPASSSDATLSGLTLSDIDFGAFASSTESYTAEVVNNPSETTVTPTVNHSGASYVIKLNGVVDADGAVSLEAGDNVITIEVTAEDGQTTKTYTVTVTRLVTSESNLASTDATLSGLTLSDINFGTFASGTTSYSAQVASSVSQTTVTPTVNHSGASYVIKLNGVVDADGAVSLEAGDNVITIEVTAEDGQTTKTYTITVTRLVTSESNLASTDATLSGLTLSDINFGTFSSGAELYTASVAYGVSQTTVTPTVNHSGASFVIKLGGATDADGAVSLAVGSNVITVEVTAEDGNTTKTYTITVTRAGASTDAKLSGLTMSDVNFGTFASGTTSYSAQVASSVSRTVVTPTANHSGASYVIKRGGAVDADGAVLLSVGANVITVEVTAEDGITKQTYTLTVTRAAPTDQTQSTDATLRALTLSGIDFGTFDSTKTTYTTSVLNSVSQTTVTATPNHTAATYAVTLGGVTDSDGVVPLSVGSNSITVEVTAEDGVSTEIYSITVTRKAQPSTDVTLSSLTLSGIDFGTFAPSTTTYSVEVANSVSSTTLTATSNHIAASYVVKLNGMTDADGTVSLAVGSNSITVEVTAEDGSSTRTYTVTVTRAEAPASQVDSVVLLKAVVNDSRQKEALTAELSELMADLFIEYLIVPDTGETPDGVRTRLSEQDSFNLLVAVLNDAVEKAALTDAVSDSLSDILIEYLIVPVTGETAAQVRERLSLQPTHTPTVTVTPTPAKAQTPTTTRSTNSTSTATPTPTTIPTPPPTAENVPNTPATGAPTIPATAKVGQTLTVNTSGISDADGIENVNFSFNWYAGRYFRATGPATTYRIRPDDVGLRISVSAYFRDNRGNQEVVDSAQTSVVAAVVPDAPQNLTASATGSRALSVQWDALTHDTDAIYAFYMDGFLGDGGSSITGYTVQWIDADRSWDTTADVSSATISNTSYTITELTAGEEYDVRVRATNSVGNGAFTAEVSATPSS